MDNRIFELMFKDQKVLEFYLGLKAEVCSGLLDAQDCIHPHTEVCGFLHQQSWHKNNREDSLFGIRYYKDENNIIVNIGDGFRHEIYIDGKHWNRILKIIKNDELDNEGIKAIIRGLINRAIPEEYEEFFINSVKNSVIKFA